MRRGSVLLLSGLIVLSVIGASAAHLSLDAGVLQVFMMEADIEPVPEPQSEPERVESFARTSEDTPVNTASPETRDETAPEPGGEPGEPEDTEQPGESSEDTGGEVEPGDNADTESSATGGDAPTPEEVDPRPEPVEVEPFLMVGRSSCRDIQGQYNAEWQEARVDGKSLQDGAFGPTRHGLRVTLENVSGRAFDWWSTIPVAAIVVATDGGDSFVYRYDEEALRGVELTVPSVLRDIGHVSFCYEPIARPAADGDDPHDSDTGDDDGEAEGEGGAPTVEVLDEEVESDDGLTTEDSVITVDTAPQPTQPVPIGPGFVDGTD